MVPEIRAALEQGREQGVTLMHMVLTWRAGDLAAGIDSSAKRRRQLDFQHLAQWLRRQGKPFEYFKGAETHTNGTVHFHLLAITRYITQRQLSVEWVRCARGAPIVYIQAVGMHRPRCWPGPNAPQRRKRESMIIPLRMAVTPVDTARPPG